jgi:tetratricopeptide (TPR) repeat protein
MEFNPIPNRSASDSIRGYIYQADLTIVRWLDLSDNQVLELECGEDIDLVDLVGKDTAEQKRVMEQVKGETKPLSLRSTNIRESLAYFYEHRRRHPNLDLYFRYTTNADMTKERHSPLPQLGVNVWERLRKAAVSLEEKPILLNEIRQLLKSDTKPTDLQTTFWTQFQSFVDESTEEDLEAFIKRFEIATFETPSDTVGERIKSLLVEQKHARNSDEALVQYQRLFFYVVKLLASDDSKSLSAQDLLNQLSIQLNASEIQQLRMIQDLAMRISTVERDVEELKVSRREFKVVQEQQSVDLIELKKQLDGAIQSVVTTAKRLVGRWNEVKLENFTDRTTERAELRALLTQQNLRLVQVVGRGGTGKATLITKVMKELFADDQGRAFVIISKDTVNKGGFFRILSNLSETLSPEQQMQWDVLCRRYPDDFARQSADLLERIERPTLLYLDTFESYLDDAENSIAVNYSELASFVRTILTTESSLTLVVSSQRPVMFEEELQSQIVPYTRQYPPSNGLQGLLEDDALALFYKLGEVCGVREVREETLREIIRRSSGFPQVLRRLVGYVLKQGASYSFSNLLEEEIIEQMVENPSQAMYKHLNDDEQKLMNVLAVLGKPSAIEAIAHVADMTNSQTRSCLAQLHQQFALYYNQTYSLESGDTIYIAKQIELSTRLSLHRKSAAYYRSKHPLLNEVRHLADLQSRFDEFYHLVEAENFNDACNLLTDFDMRFLLPFGQALTVLDLHLQLEGRVTNRGFRLFHFMHLGAVYTELGMFSNALNYHTQALTLAEEIWKERKDDVSHENVGVCYGNLANHYLITNNLVEARKHISPALTLAEKFYKKHRHERNSRYARNLSSQFGNLGLIFLTLKHLDKAAKFLTMALNISRANGHQQGVIMWRGYLGSLALADNNPEEARKQFRQSLDEATRLGHTKLMAIWLEQLGKSYSQENGWIRALACFIVALHLYGGMASPYILSVINHLKDIQAKADDFAESITSLFRDGDAVFESATGQNFDYFRNAPGSAENLVAFFEETKK